MMRWIVVIGALVLSGCVATTQSPQGQSSAPQTGTAAPDQTAVARFESVVARVEPVAEGICRQQLPGGNCDFLVQVDTRPNQPPNAFQTLDRDGRPILAFNTMSWLLFLAMKRHTSLPGIYRKLSTMLGRARFCWAVWPR